MGTPTTTMRNGGLPIKVQSAQFITVDPIAIWGFLLTSSGAAAACLAAIQDASNHDVATLNTTTSNGVSSVFFPQPLPLTGLSVTTLTGTGAVLYIYPAGI